MVRKPRGSGPSRQEDRSDPSPFLELRGRRLRSGVDAIADPSEFRQYLYPLDHPRVASLRDMDARAYVAFAAGSARGAWLREHFLEKYAQPFTGLSADGIIRSDVYRREAVRPGEAAPTARMVEAARTFLSYLLPPKRAKARYPFESRERRGWNNQEWLLNDIGVRLEEIDPRSRDAFLELVAASLSKDGAHLIDEVRQTNAFLGGLTHAEGVMNEYSYQAAIYGEPSVTDPWGWQLYGHHLALNVTVFGDEMVVSPVFLAAEPTVIDEGPYAGTRLFAHRSALALELAQRLTLPQLESARIYRGLRDPSMPEGRLHPADERTVAGCFSDNNVVPYEGIRADKLDDTQRGLLWDLVEDFYGLLPSGPRAAQMRRIRSFAEETWFCWIGEIDGSHPFYYRVQSPVTLVESDAHGGLWLSNDEPAPFHLHTMIRSPNAGDYGRAMVANGLGAPVSTA